MDSTKDFVQIYQYLFFEASLKLKVKFAPQLLTYEPLFNALCNWILCQAKDEFLKIDEFQIYLNECFAVNFDAYVNFKNKLKDIANF